MIPAENCPRKSRGSSPTDGRGKLHLVPRLCVPGRGGRAHFQKTYTLTDGTHTASVHHLYVMRLRVNGSWQVAYCIEPDTGVYPGIDYGTVRMLGYPGIEGSSYAESAAGHRHCYALQRAAPSGHVIFCRERGMEAATQIMIWGRSSQVCEAAPLPTPAQTPASLTNLPAASGTATGKITPSVPSGPNTAFSAENWQSTA